MRPRGATDPRERFAALVATPDPEVRLDEGALCIAACGRPGLDVDAWLGRLDELAGTCEERSFAGVRATLFDRLGFRGDAERYHDPENSFLDAVVERRRGLPITLSVLVVEVARRVGVRVHPVGMPGHFLVRAEGDDLWCDPFRGGSLIDVDGCRALFDAVYGGQRPFAPALLAPTPTRPVLARMLANLEHGPLGQDPEQLAWLCELHLSIPGVAPSERVALLERLAGVVPPARAAAAYDAVAGSLTGDARAALEARARSLRSRLN